MRRDLLITGSALLILISGGVAIHFMKPKTLGDVPASAVSCKNPSSGYTIGSVSGDVPVGSYAITPDSILIGVAGTSTDHSEARPLSYDVKGLTQVPVTLTYYAQCDETGGSKNEPLTPQQYADLKGGSAIQVVPASI